MQHYFTASLFPLSPSLPPPPFILYLSAYLLSPNTSLFPTDVHQGEADQPCDEGRACWQQEQGDGGGCRHGWHGICHQRAAQGESERCEEKELSDVCVYQ